MGWDIIQQDTLFKKQLKTTLKLKNIYMTIYQANINKKYSNIKEVKFKAKSINRTKE